MAGRARQAHKQGVPLGAQGGRTRSEVTPHTLRHTAITWQAQLGVPSHEICGFFGITMDVFERVYGHHHPDYQSNAVNAFNRSRQKPDRYTETERERVWANVIKLVGKR